MLTVGDELLLGDTVNGNAAWLGRRLTDHGADVTRSVVVGDETDVIVAAVTSALERADAVITTGGLGPTYDDVTRDALAKAAGVALVRDAALERRLRERVARAAASCGRWRCAWRTSPRGPGCWPTPPARRRACGSSCPAGPCTRCPASRSRCAPSWTRSCCRSWRRSPGCPRWRAAPCAPPGCGSRWSRPGSPRSRRWTG
ncbi:molybdopterin-binding protein [Actinomadura madurae]|nr:molybdopterin-binding protein [Actinomadura madurae]